MTAGLFVVALLAGACYSAGCWGNGLAVGMLMILLAIGVARSFSCREARINSERMRAFDGDLDVWPFVSRAQLEAAMETWPQWRARAQRA